MLIFSVLHQWDTTTCSSFMLHQCNITYSSFRAAPVWYNYMFIVQCCMSVTQLHVHLLVLHQCDTTSWLSFSSASVVDDKHRDNGQVKEKHRNWRRWPPPFPPPAARSPSLPHLPCPNDWPGDWQRQTTPATRSSMSVGSKDRRTSEWRRGQSFHHRRHEAVISPQTDAPCPRAAARVDSSFSGWKQWRGFSGLHKVCSNQWGVSLSACTTHHMQRTTGWILLIIKACTCSAIKNAQWQLELLTVVAIVCVCVCVHVCVCVCVCVCVFAVNGSDGASTAHTYS